MVSAQHYHLVVGAVSPGVIHVAIAVSRTGVLIGLGN
jgi:hypothetical protein